VPVAHSRNSRTGPKLALLSLAAAPGLGCLRVRQLIVFPRHLRCLRRIGCCGARFLGGEPRPVPMQSYQPHMDFSHESKFAAVNDPQMLIAAPAASAATGPQMIGHAVPYA